MSFACNNPPTSLKTTHTYTFLPPKKGRMSPAGAASFLPARKVERMRAFFHATLAPFLRAGVAWKDHSLFNKTLSSLMTRVLEILPSGWTFVSGASYATFWLLSAEFISGPPAEASKTSSPRQWSFLGGFFFNHPGGALSTPVLVQNSRFMGRRVPEIPSFFASGLLAIRSLLQALQTIC